MIAIPAVSIACHPLRWYKPRMAREIDPADGLILSEAGEWADIKHLLLGKYVSSSSGARASWGPSTYVDLYSGPGRQRVEETGDLINGSPLVAWVASKVERKPFSKVLISDKRQFVNACESRLKALGAPVMIAAHKATDAANVAAAQLDPTGLHLIFADPYNLKDLPWSVFEPLLRFQHIDFIVHFSQADLTRNLDRYITENPSPLDTFAPGWRATIERGGKVTTRGQVFEYWVGLWKAAGFHLAEGVPLISSTGGAPLYRLALFSRHKLASKIWASLVKAKSQRTLSF